MLEISNLTFSFKKDRLFNDINLSINSNFAFLVGGNGSGKTTFLNLIAKVYKFKGEILFNKENIKRKELFYMESERLFLPKITGEEYLKYRGILLGITLEKEYLEKLAFIFDLPLNHYVENYSTGMKKKIEFIPCLFKRYSIYLFDEPFIGLDFESKKLIQKGIINLINDQSFILMSTHDLDFIKKYSNNTIFKIDKNTIKSIDFNYLENNVLNIDHKIINLDNIYNNIKL